MSTVLITGASSGIGFELAKTCAACGHDLILTARRKGKLVELQESLQQSASVKVEIVEGDLADPKFPCDLYTEIKSRDIEVDILINNAGAGHRGAFLGQPIERQLGVLQLNDTALMELTYYFAQDMVKRGRGRIMNVASSAAFFPGPFMSVYYASKAFVLHFSEGLANELKGAGVSVTCLCPGPTVTEFDGKADMGRTRLFNLVKPASARSVAQYGYKAMMKGHVVAVHGLMNRLLVFSARFGPRFMIRHITRLLNSLQ